MKVEVTQFYRPNGRQRTHTIEVSDDCKEKYDQLRAAGCRLTAEELMTEVVSQCIEHNEGDFEQVLTFPNDRPQNIQPDLEKLIKSFDKAKFDVWLERLQDIA